MKQTIQILLALLLVFTITSCSEESKIGRIAKAYNKALFQGEFEKAKSYCTPQTSDGINQFEKLLDENKLETLKNSKVAVKLTKVEIDANGKDAIATCVLDGCIDFSSGKVRNGIETRTKMYKYRGKWMVEFKIK